MEPGPFYEATTTAEMVERGKETLHIKAPDLTLEERVEQLEDALLAVVKRLAALERQSAKEAP